MASIHDAAYDGDLAALNRLLQEDGGLLNTQNTDDGGTPLICAVAFKRDAVVTRLVALGADVELPDVHEATAVSFACSNNAAPCLALLLDAGASHTTRDPLGLTPLMVAALRRSTECLKLLLALESSW